MAQEQRLLTIQNDSHETITDSWDAITYSFEPGVPVTMAYGLGVHFRERHPQLVAKGEKFGLAPETVVVEVQLVNPSEHPLTVSWDGRPYVFEPGVPTGVDSSIATPLVVQARTVINEHFPKGGQLEVAQDAVSRNPQKPEPVIEPVAEPKPVEPEEDPKDEKPKKKKSTKS